MKNLTSLLAVLLILTAGCQEEKDSSSFILDQSFELTCNEVKTDDGNGLIISLDSVLNDSRCPKGCYCFWEGNAEARFIFSHDHNRTSFVLNTFGGWRTDTLINGYRIKLIHILPYPEIGTIIRQSDYRAEIEITEE
jgi:hypothetical protein